MELLGNVEGAGGRRKKSVTRKRACPICGTVCERQQFKGKPFWTCPECQKENYFRRDNNMPYLEVGERIPKLPSGAPMPINEPIEALRAAVITAMDYQESLRLKASAADEAQAEAEAALGRAQIARAAAYDEWSDAIDRYHDARAALKAAEQG
jgi:uncharacterized Zn finger protein (UPF0148 family)